MQSFPRCRSILLAAVLGGLWLAGPAQAADGVLEINQTCVSTGCFSGDTAGYPVTIDGSAGRSYRLTGDLVLSTQFGLPQTVNLIEISAADVTLDLGGFGIQCRLLAGMCQGTGSGVFADFSINGTSVKNGTIRGMAEDGVQLVGNAAEITSLRAQSNRFYGIRVGSGSTVSGNTVRENGDDGILAGPGSTVSGNTASSNGNRGIVASVGSTVSGNTASSNGNRGIFGSTGSTVSDNTASSNGDDGIFAFTGATVSDNTASSNGDDGIEVSGNTRVADNTCDDNVGAGVHVTNSDNRIDGNTVTDNGLGLDVDQGGNLIIRNSASGNGMNYSNVVAGNTMGEVLNTTAAGGTITETTSPWANFSF